MKILFELIYNLGILVSISIISGFVLKLSKTEWTSSILQGLIFGSAAVIGMLNPLIVTSGLIFDGRSIVISISGLFFGPIAAIISGTMAIILRINQGGTGVIVGTLVIIMSASVGAIFNIMKNRKNFELKISMIFLMGIIVHVLMILLMFILPNGKGFNTILLIGIPVLIAYPVATVLIGKILINDYNYKLMVDELRESKISLTSSNEELNASLEELTIIEEELQNQFVQLQISEEQFRLLITQMKQGIAVHEIICDNEGNPVNYRYINVNESYEKITGLCGKDIIGKTVLDISHNSEKHCIEKFGKVALTGETYQYETYEHELDKYFSVSVYSPRLNQFAIILEDITNRKKTEWLLNIEKQQFETTLLSVADGVISTDNFGNIMIINKVAEQLTGWSKIEALGKPLGKVFNIIDEFTRKKCDNPVDLVLRTECNTELINHTILLSKTGIEIPIEDSSAPIKDSDGKITGMVIVFRDVTEKRHKQKQIEYLSFNDYLTGLYNRRYIEDEIKRLDSEKNLPLTVMVLDVNGLKLTNDAFGHETGDKLLKVAANIMRKVCRESDIIGRIGGDEFIILLPKTDEKQAEKIKKRIGEECSRIKLDSVIISLAIGYAVKNNIEQDIENIEKNADNIMYKNKIKHGKIMRSETIETVLRNINLKYDQEQIHTEMVSQYCEAIARAMNLSEKKIYDIKTAGILHDIGKITVSYNLLNKEGKLTEEEFNQIKRHTEAGYQILKSVDEYVSLAEAVLYHHERYDGTGYPEGLKGEEIPLEARIISVADSYEAMTSKRPYQMSKTKEEAIAELKKCSCTQFDEDIVKVFIENVL